MNRVKHIILTFIVLTIIYSSCAFGNNKNELCPANMNPLTCLKANFDELYEKNYDRFWDIAHGSAEKALTCDSLQDTIAFLDIVNIKSINEEFKEFFSEIIERMVKEETECFLDTLTHMDENSQKRIIEKLSHPVFAEKETVKKALKKTQNEKLKAIVKLYFPD